MKKQIIIITLFFPNLLFGQDSLALMEAIKISMWNNYDIQITAKQQHINRINNNWASAGALPTINLSLKKEEALSSFRISVGLESTQEDIDKAAKIICNKISFLRK